MAVKVTLLGEIWGTDEEGIVQPSIAAIGRSLELRGSLEVEGGIALGIFAVVDDTTIANVNIHAIIRSDAVDGLQFRAMLRLVNELIISTTVDDGTLDTRPLEGAASDGYDNALAVLRLPYPIRLAERHLQLQGELQRWRFFRFDNLCAGHHDRRQQQNSR